MNQQSKNYSIAQLNSLTSLESKDIHTSNQIKIEDPHQGFQNNSKQQLHQQQHPQINKFIYNPVQTKVTKDNQPINFQRRNREIISKYQKKVLKQSEPPSQLIRYHLADSMNQRLQSNQPKQKQVLRQTDFLFSYPIPLHRSLIRHKPTEQSEIISDTNNSMAEYSQNLLEGTVIQNKVQQQEKQNSSFTTKDQGLMIALSEGSTGKRLIREDAFTFNQKDIIERFKAEAFQGEPQRPQSQFRQINQPSRQLRIRKLAKDAHSGVGESFNQRQREELKEQILKSQLVKEGENQRTQFYFPSHYESQNQGTSNTNHQSVSQGASFFQNRNSKKSSADQGIKISSDLESLKYLSSDLVKQKLQEVTSQINLEQNSFHKQSRKSLSNITTQSKSSPQRSTQQNDQDINMFKSEGMKLLSMNKQSVSYSQQQNLYDMSAFQVRNNQTQQDQRKKKSLIQLHSQRSSYLLNLEASNLDISLPSQAGKLSYFSNLSKNVDLNQSQNQSNKSAIQASNQDQNLELPCMDEQQNLQGSKISATGFGIPILPSPLVESQLKRQIQKSKDQAQSSPKNKSQLWDSPPFKNSVAFVPAGSGLGFNVNVTKYLNQSSNQLKGWESPTEERRKKKRERELEKEREKEKERQAQIENQSPNNRESVMHSIINQFRSQLTFNFKMNEAQTEIEQFDIGNEK